MKNDVTKNTKEGLTILETKIKDIIDSGEPDANFVSNLERFIEAKASIDNINEGSSMENRNFIQRLLENKYSLALASVLLLAVFALGVMIVISSNGQINPGGNNENIGNNGNNNTQNNTEVKNPNEIQPAVVYEKDLSKWKGVEEVFVSADVWPCDTSKGCSLSAKPLPDRGSSVSFIIPSEWKFQQTSFEPARNEYNLKSQDNQVAGRILPTYTAFVGGFNCTSFKDSDFLDIGGGMIVASSNFEYQNVTGKKVTIDYGEKFLAANGYRYSREYCSQGKFEGKKLNVASNFRFDSVTLNQDLDYYFDNIVSSAKLNMPIAATTIPSTTVIPAIDMSQMKRYSSSVWNFGFDYPAVLGDPVVLESIDKNCEALKFTYNSQTLLIQLAAGNYHCNYAWNASTTNMDMYNIYGIGNVQPMSNLDGPTMLLNRSGQEFNYVFQKRSEGESLGSPYRIVAYNNVKDGMPEGYGSAAGVELPSKNVLAYYVYGSTEEGVESWKNVIRAMVTSSETNFTRK